MCRLCSHSSLVALNQNGYVIMTNFHRRHDCEKIIKEALDLQERKKSEKVKTQAGKEEESCFGLEILQVFISFSVNSPPPQSDLIHFHNSIFAGFFFVASDTTGCSSVS